MSAQVNRSLTVVVTFNCTHDASNNTYGGSATYAQASSFPELGPVVDSDGSIHLDRAPAPPAGFSENVDIFFVLNSPATVTPDNTTLPVVWASVHGVGVSIHPHGLGTSGEFTVVTTSNPNVILVQDEDDDSNTYDYKPAVELPSVGNYYISLDPKIVNRPP
jgi:hypothetical protein